MAKAEKFSVVGRRVQRVEGFDKVTGDSKFIADVFLPNMLVGKVLRSPFPHARIRSMDTRKAEKLRGVRAVVTAEDTIKRPWGAFFADQHIGKKNISDEFRITGDFVEAFDSLNAAADHRELFCFCHNYNLF